MKIRTSAQRSSGGAGKGDRRRPRAVSREEYEANFDAIFAPKADDRSLVPGRAWQNSEWVDMRVVPGRISVDHPNPGRLPGELPAKKGKK